MTQVIAPADPRKDDSVFDIPKSREIKGLIYKGTFTVVERNKVGNNANILDGRFELAVKNFETSQPTHKARFVVQ